LRKHAPYPEAYEQIMQFARAVSPMPGKDNRTPDEIIGYDENGLPT